MKIKIYIFLTFFIALNASVFAQENATTSTTERRGNFQTIPPEREAQVAQTRKKLESQNQVRVTNLAANISNRFDAINARLLSIIARVESRITKLEAEGVQLQEAKAEIASAKQSLARAQESMGTIDIQVTQTVTSEDPQNKWQSVKTQFTSIRTELSTAKEHIKAAITITRNAVAAKNKEVINQTNGATIEQ